MGIESFDDAQVLDGAALTALLESERPEQRVWAIWALAGKTEPGSLAHRVVHEPDPGVRRTLAVLVASHGELDLLVALARHDPVVVVRASAMQLVTRLAAREATHPDMRVLRPVVEDAARSTEPEIVIALLGALAPWSPEWQVAIAHRLLEARDFEVQAEAFEALLRAGTPAGRDAARSWMLRQPAPWTVVDRWVRAADMESLGDAFLGTAMAVRGHVLGKLRSPPWSVVELLIEEDLELLRAMLRRTDVAIPARVLASTIMRGAHPGFVERLADQLAIAGQGRQLLADLRRAIELYGGKTGAPLTALFARARQFADALEIVDRDDMLHDVAAQHPVEQLLGLDNAVAQWLARTDAPFDLLPLIPALRRYCAQHLAGLGGGGGGSQRPQLPAPGQATAATPMANERKHFERLAAALDRIVAPSRS